MSCTSSLSPRCIPVLCPQPHAGVPCPMLCPRPLSCTRPLSIIPVAVPPCQSLPSGLGGSSLSWGSGGRGTPLHQYLPVPSLREGGPDLASPCPCTPRHWAQPHHPPRCQQSLSPSPRGSPRIGVSPGVCVSCPPPGADPLGRLGARGCFGVLLWGCSSGPNALGYLPARSPPSCTPKPSAGTGGPKRATVTQKGPQSPLLAAVRALYGLGGGTTRFWGVAEGSPPGPPAVCLP